MKNADTNFFSYLKKDAANEPTNCNATAFSKLKQAKAHKNISGVSAALRNMSIIENEEVLLEKDKTSEFTIKVANTLEEREAVFNLGYRVYLEKGYVKENTNQWLVLDYDAKPETLILMVKDKNNNIAGSVTLVFKNKSSLPAEKIYKEEINLLAVNGKKLVEISRLVIDPNYRNSKEIILLLFNYLSIYAHHIKSYDSLMIQVNPRHVGYYEKLLNFQEIGQEKMCPSVQNAPAILMELPLAKYQSEVKRFSNNPSQNKKERLLYASFLKADQESLVAYYLEKQVKPISAEEKLYFGFSESGIHQKVYA